MDHRRWTRRTTETIPVRTAIWSGKSRRDGAWPGLTTIIHWCWCQTGWLGLPVETVIIDQVLANPNVTGILLRHALAS